MAFVAPVLGFMPKYHNSFIHSPGSVHALALQEEVSKMLLKGALEPLDQPGDSLGGGGGGKVCLLCYLDNWPVVAELGSGDRCQLGEVRPPAVHLCPRSGDADRHVSREDVPV